MAPHTRSSAFTLIELAIVLVIIGLLFGGVVAGKNLIRSGELRNLMSDLRSYETAAAGFRDKYDAMPGDMRDFQRYFPACIDGAGPYTCNGNGNGNIQDSAAPINVEYQRVFEHMAKAGFIPGDYNGSLTSSLANFPSFWPFSKATKNYIALRWQEGSFWPDGKSGNVLYMFVWDEEVMTTAEIRKLDNKLDDDNGFTGKFRILNEDGPTCIDSSGVYQPSEPTYYCQMQLFGSYTR